MNGAAEARGVGEVVIQSSVRSRMKDKLSDGR